MQRCEVEDVCIGYRCYNAFFAHRRTVLCRGWMKMERTMLDEMLEAIAHSSNHDIGYGWMHFIGIAYM